MSPTPRYKRVSARAIIIKGEKIVLMYRKKQEREYYVFPGGGIQKGETLEQAVVREVWEEASLEVDSPVFLYKYEDDESEQHFFLCQYVSGELRLGKGEENEKMIEDPSNIYKPGWYTLDEMYRLPIYPTGACEQVCRKVIT